MSFLYNVFGDHMKVYLDLVMFLNFFLDFLLLVSVSILLKRNVKIIRLIIASFIGGLSILLLFVKLNSLELFLFKALISIIMILIGFGYKNIKYTLMNILYLYIVSVFLGGGLYLVNNSFSLKNNGIVFVNNGFSINIIVIIIISPIIIYIYNIQAKKIKNKYNNYYDVSIYYNNQKLDVVGFMDTGNTLKYKKNNVLLLDKRKNIFKTKKYILIPYNTIDKISVMKAFKPSKVIINNKEINNCLIGLIDNINLDGINIILNNGIGDNI